MRNHSLFAAAVAIVLLGMTCIAHAAQTFDLPAKKIHISSTKPYIGDGADCIYYSDVMIYIPGTDGPSPANATIVPDAATARCSRTPPSKGITVHSEGYFPVGRKGRFLLFAYVDWIDFDSFLIFDAHDGHELFQDGFSGNLTAVRLTHGVLHLHYTRGVDLTCSLMLDRDRCWSEAIATGQIPHGAFSAPPSLANCKANYFFPGSIPASTTDPHWKLDENDPSVVYYDVDLTLDINGHATVQTMGNLKCAARL